MSQKHHYSYDGPVMVYDKCVESFWKGSTYAPSESKAKSNLAHQYKQQTGKIASIRVTLPGKLKIID